MRDQSKLNMAEILKEVNNIFNEILDDEDVVLTNETTGDDIEEWDSLNNIQIVVAIEKHFEIRFTAPEIQGFKNVGEMCQAISQRLSPGSDVI